MINEEFNTLSELIILNKILYYYPETFSQKIHDVWQVCDDQYDNMEQRYLILCKQLNVENTLVHKQYIGLEVFEIGMFEVDFGRNDVKAVIEKWNKKK